jgi:hypothetical protein
MKQTKARPIGRALVEQVKPMTSYGISDSRFSHFSVSRL